MAEAYDWSKTNEVGVPAEAMPDGEHDVTLVRLFWDKRDGNPLMSRSGIPQMGVVFANENGEEATYYCSLSNGDIHWPERSIVPVLRSLSGVTMATLQAKGVTPEMFLNKDWANKMLVTTTRTARIRVGRHQAKPGPDGSPGKVYIDVTPLVPGTPAPAGTPPVTSTAKPRSNKVEDATEEPLPF